MKKKSVFLSNLPFDRNEAHRQTLNEAERSNAFSARIMLGSAIHQMRKRDPLLPDLADFVASFLERILENPERALLVQRGRRSGQFDERDIQLAFAVREKVASGVPLRNRSKRINPPPDAISIVAEDCKQSLDVVSHSYRKFAPGTDFGPPPLPQPNNKKKGR